MKKHDEGYVLAYVTVVLLLFCLIASMILTGAMKNMNNQQDTIARMQDQYVAAGMIEQVVAKLESGTSISESDSYEESDGETIKKLTIDVNDDIWILTARYGSITVSCEIVKENGSFKYETYEIGGAVE